MLMLQHSCDIQRNQDVGTNGRKQLATLASGVSCLVLPMSAQAAVENQFTIGKGYEVYFADGQDIQAGDKLLSGGKSYIVRGAQPFQVPLVGHVRALCEQELS